MSNEKPCNKDSPPPYPFCDVIGMPAMERILMSLLLYEWKHKVPLPVVLLLYSHGLAKEIQFK